ncbi:MAG: SRPBCC domain-containing protein [Saprospiraceae bacterium]|nr:SRPBCC domain-containing protein [Saprospiraceae bacterium]
MSGTNLHFEITISASKDHVYQTMISDAGYRNWTSAFNATSCFRGTWATGSKMYFVGCDADGNVAGMVSIIATNIPGEYISIEHIGELNGANEILEGPSVDVWKGSLENYTFDAIDNGATLLKIDMIGGVAEYTDYFNETWPKALELLKKLCET